MPKPTIQDAIYRLGYDELDAQSSSNIPRALDAADSYLRSAVGDDIWDLLPDDHKAHELVMIYLEDLYDGRDMSAKSNNARQHMISTMEQQLRLELRAAREAAEASGV